MAQDPFQGWGGSQGGAGAVDPFGEFPFQMPTPQPQQQQQKQFNAPQDPAPLVRPPHQDSVVAQPAGPGAAANNTSFMPPPPPHGGGGGADPPGARASNNSGFPATQNPFENQALNTAGVFNAAGGAGGGSGASLGVAGGLNEAPPAGTNSGAGVVEDLFGVAGGEGAGAMVPYGQQQQRQQQPLESHPLHQHHHHTAPPQQQHHQTYQGAIVPFQQQQQQQQQQASGGTLVVASNPFDDLLGGVPTAVGTGTGAGILQQQRTPRQPPQQQWPGHPFAGPQQQQQYQQQQHQQQQQQSWLGQGGAARNGDVTADGGLQLMQPQYPPHQQQLQIVPVQQPFQQQQVQTVAPGNPFFHAAQDLPQQQQKTAPGADLFGDDPFGASNSGSKGPPPVPGGGSSADAGGPFDFDAVSAAVPAVNAAAATGRRVSGGSAGSSSAGDEGRRGRGGGSVQHQQQEAAPGGRGRGTTTSSSSGGRGRAPPSTAGELPVRLSRSSRSRSVSVPRGTAAERGRGSSRPLSDADPFGSNSGRHGAPPPQSAQQQQGQGGRASRGSTGALSRRNSFGATSRRGTSRGALAGGGGGGAGAVDDFEGNSVVMRTASGGSLRGGGVGGFATRNQRQQQQQQRRGGDPYDNTYDHEDDDEREGDHEEDDDGYDSDTMSVMDQEAIRASMRKRGARERGGGAGGRRGDDTVEYIVEFERARKLGMLLERHDEWPDGREKRSERAIVKMVVDSGPAQIRGVTVGSKVKRVNGDTVEGLTYQQTLECIKNAARPLRVEFERGQLEQEDNVGQILFKKTVGVPRSYSAWQRRYFVLGGAVAKVHVLQVYVSKQSYDRMVLAVFENRRINERVKAYKLSNLFKCGPIKVKSFKGHPTPLYFFTVKLPKSRLKQLNFASQNLGDLQHLRTSISKFTST